MCQKSSDQSHQIEGIIISTRGENPHDFARSLRDSIHELILIVTERRTLDLNEDATFGLNLLTSICVETEEPRIAYKE